MRPSSRPLPALSRRPARTPIRIDGGIRGFRAPNDVLIRIATQPGGDAAQQQAVARVQQTLGAYAYTYRRVEVVGPRVSGELAWSGSLSVIFPVAGILLYVWVRSGWQVGAGAGG